jgi:hypothetical protein
MYHDIPAGGTAVHGAQRILVFRNEKYIGHYHLDMMDRRVTIRGSSIYINVPHRYGDEIKITTEGPPARAYLDQDLIWFSR